eukprot:superscaffoldBa00006462_g21563
MDPQAKDRTSPAAGGFGGRLASLGADGGDSESGAGEEEAAVGCCSDTFSSLPDMEQETLEEKLRTLAFRKQTSYRFSPPYTTMARERSLHAVSRCRL